MRHGPEGEADGPVGAQLKPPAAELSSAKSKTQREAELLKIVRQGSPGTGMVAWTDQLLNAEIDDVGASLLSLRK